MAESKNTNKRGSITVQLTSSLCCLDSAALLMLNEQQFDLSNRRSGVQ